MIYHFGEAALARRGARHRGRRRDTPSRTTGSWRASCGARGRSRRIDPATRTFQAIRIWVNGELSLDPSCALCSRLGRRAVRGGDVSLLETGP
jgi:16S rRNA C1402 N4-methylase RsmH